MKDQQALARTLERIDGRGYKAYKDIQASYAFPRFRLHIDHVQGDPFAAPSRLCAEFRLDELALPDWSHETAIRRKALADFLTRRVAAGIAHRPRLGGGSGKSGEMNIERPGQEVLARSAMVVAPPHLECRFTIGLPAQGRRVLGGQAQRILVEALPGMLIHALAFEHMDEQALRGHVESVEDQAALRGQLAGRGLVAFIGDGACLPRRSGVDPRPLDEAVLFQSPDSLSVTLETPNGGPVTGLGIPEGVSLIVGGGYHGKSTVLDAIQLGIYEHCPGDGRERVVSRPRAVKIRAEDGRRVEDVNIGAFIRDLPGGRSTTSFSSDNASGSTSQAANIVEALEMGADVLLIDEDTSATNFMIRDARMQQLIAREPIVPFIDRVGELARDMSVSTVMVVGGAGDYLDVADTVILMEDYRAFDVTGRASAIAAENPSDRRREVEAPFGALKPRRPRAASLDPSRGKREVKIMIRARHHIEFGTWPIDLSALEQLAARAQTRAIGEALVLVKHRLADGRRSMADLVRELDAIMETDGVDALTRQRRGDVAEVRGMEIIAALNRLRSLTLAD